MLPRPSLPCQLRDDVGPRGVLAIAEMRTRIMRPGTRLEPSLEDAGAEYRCRARPSATSLLITAADNALL